MRRSDTSVIQVEYVVVGLGNPGPTYEGTRHNLGYRVIEELARRHGFAKAKRGHHGRFALGRIAGHDVLLLQPTTYMNESGRSVADVVRKYGVPLGRLMVVHDHIDLPFGRLRLMSGGGSGGHNGLKSVTGLVGAEYVRLRVGVDRPASYDPEVVAAYVLAPFAEPRATVEALVAAAADAVELWLDAGLESAANSVNSGNA
ncbi:MAG: aminoacyl-tRNA hydrolase [Thermoleophilia bacterium]